eukprot:3830270-Lingulodinium_polyedra.AAC.1
MLPLAGRGGSNNAEAGPCVHVNSAPGVLGHTSPSRAPRRAHGGMVTRGGGRKRGQARRA